MTKSGVRRTSKRDNYFNLLDEFGGSTRSPAENVAYLVKKGLTHNQARNAVYRYRVTHGLIRRDPGQQTLE